MANGLTDLCRIVPVDEKSYSFMMRALKITIVHSHSHKGPSFVALPSPQHSRSGMVEAPAENGLDADAADIWPFECKACAIQTSIQKKLQLIVN